MHQSSCVPCGLPCGLCYCLWRRGTAPPSPMTTMLYSFVVCAAWNAVQCFTLSSVSKAASIRITIRCMPSSQSVYPFVATLIAHTLITKFLSFLRSSVASSSAFTPPCAVAAVTISRFPRSFSEACHRAAPFILTHRRTKSKSFLKRLLAGGGGGGGAGGDDGNDDDGIYMGARQPSPLRPCRP